MPKGSARPNAGGKPAAVALALDVADDLALIVQELDDGARVMFRAISAADGEMERLFRAIALLDGYAVGLRETPRATPTRDRVYAIADARTRKAALAARTANAA